MNTFHERVRAGLSRLRAVDPTGKLVPGATSHHYMLEPPIDRRTMAAFELRHRIELPSDYREFILRLGNGGAGPLGGMFRLGEADDGNGQFVWNDADGTVGKLHRPFAHQKPWNLSAEELARIDGNDDELLVRYWSAPDGALPLCRARGVGKDWLVVCGSETGRVWHDATTSFRGWSPVVDEGGRHRSFAGWYTAWLERALASVRERLGGGSGRSFVVQRTAKCFR